MSDGFPAASDTASRPRFRRTKRALVSFLLLAALAAAVWFNRVPLLRGAAELWIVSDPVGPADAIVILGGGLGDAALCRRRVLQKGFG